MKLKKHIQNMQKAFLQMSRKKRSALLAGLSVVIAASVISSLVLPAVTIDESSYCSQPENTLQKACEEAETKADKETLIETGRFEESDFLESLPSGFEETAEVWQKMADSLELSGNWSEDLVTAAISQVGYQESEDDFEETEDGRQGLTRYGAWNDTPYAEWNSLFVGFLMDLCGIDEDAFPRAESAEKLLEAVEKQGRKQNLAIKDAWQSKPGDIVFYTFNKEENEGIRAAVVETVLPQTSALTLIEGDANGKVERLAVRIDDPDLLLAAELPKNPDFIEEMDTNLPETAEPEEKNDHSEAIEPEEKAETNTEAKADASETTEIEAIEEAKTSADEAEEIKAEAADETEASEKNEADHPIRAGPQDLFDYLNNLKFSGVKYNPADNTFEAKFEMGFKIEWNDLTQEGFYYLDLGKDVRIPDSLMDKTYYFQTGNGKNGGSYEFIPHDNGYWVQLKIDPKLIEESQTNKSPVIGDLHFSTIIHQFQQNPGTGDITVQTPVGGTGITIPGNSIEYPKDETLNYNIDTQKEGQLSVENGELIYKVTISSTKGTPDPISVQDILQQQGGNIGLKDLTLSGITVQEQTKIYTTSSWGSWYEHGTEKPNGNPYDLEIKDDTWNQETGQLNFTLPGLAGMQPTGEATNNGTTRYKANQYVVTYRYKIDDLPENAHVKFGNTVEAGAKNEQTKEEVKDSASSWIDQSNLSKKPNISKNGWFDPATQSVKWEIHFNSAHNNGAGYTITDPRFSSLKPEDLNITPSEGIQIETKSDGTVKQIKVLELQNGKNTNAYKISYSETVKGSSENQAIRNTVDIANGNDHDSANSTVHIQGISLNKWAQNRVPQADGTILTPWKAEISTPTGIQENPFVISDRLQDPQWFGKEQIKAWNGKLQMTDDKWAVNTMDLSSGQIELILITKNNQKVVLNQNKGPDTLNENDRFVAFEIRLTGSNLKNIRKIAFEYSSLVNPNDPKNQNGVIHLENKIFAGNKEVTATWPFKKPDASKNGWKPNSDQIVWRIDATVPTAPAVKELVIKDVLPEHLDLAGVKVSSGHWELGAAWNPAENKVNYNRFDTDANYSFTYNQDTRELVVILRLKDSKALPMDTTFQIELTTNIKKDELIPDLDHSFSTTFKNTAEVSWDSIHTSKPKSSVDWEYKPDSSGKLGKNGLWDKDRQQVSYSVAINSDGKPVQIEREDGLKVTPETITLEDTLTYISDQGGLEVQIVYESVQLYYGTKLEFDGMNNITNEQVPAEQWSWKYSEWTDPDWKPRKKKIIEAVVPNNGKPFVLAYSYAVAFENPSQWQRLELKNNAVIKATDHRADHSFSEEWEESETGGAIGTGGLTIIKADSENSQITIPNAEFTLYEYRGSAYVKKSVLTTDEYGRIRIPYQPGKDFSWNTAYYLQESKPAAGYLEEANPKKIYFHYSNKNIGTSNYPDGFKGTDLNKTSASHVVTNVKQNTWTLKKYSLHEGSAETAVEGAEFEVWEFIGGYPYYLKTDLKLVSGKDGTIKIRWNMDGKTPFKFNTGYYLQETKAPDGYILPNPVPKFYFYFSHGDETTYQKLFPTLDQGWSLDAVDLSAGDAETKVKNDVDPELGVALEKVWLNKDGEQINVLDTDITLNLYQIPSQFVTVKAAIQSPWHPSQEDAEAFIVKGSDVKVSVHSMYGDSREPQVFELPADARMEFQADPNSEGYSTKYPPGTFTYHLKNVQNSLNIRFHPWEPNIDQVKVEVVRAEQISFDQLENYKDPYRTVVLNSNNGWKTSLFGLPHTMKDEDGNTVPCMYIVEEVVPGGYEGAVENGGVILPGTTKSIKITNTATNAAILPSTGGAGTKGIMTAGALLVAVGAVLALAVKKRKE